ERAGLVDGRGVRAAWVRRGLTGSHRPGREACGSLVFLAHCPDDTTNPVKAWWREDAGVTTPRGGRYRLRATELAAASTSATRSSRPSTPTLSRTNPAPIPSRARSSAGTEECVVVALTQAR